MSTNIKIINKSDANLPPIQILLAESDPLEIDRIIASVDLQFQIEIKIVSTYNDLLARITKQEPQLLLLGRIDKSNYFDTCAQCHLICDRLPIVLISKQGTISESFRQLAKDYGMRDVIYAGSVELDRLFQTLDRPRYQHTTGQMMLTGLGEIVTISNNYFGPLAQGNYWRKAHARIVDEFPSITNWSADHFSKIDCDESILDRVLTDRDLQSLRIWVQIFIEECERIIIDYRTILNNSDLSPLAKNLLTKS